MASAMIDRAEFPVHRNRTLWCPCITSSRFWSVAARRPTARLLCGAWFHGAEEGAQKLSVHLRGESVDVDSLPGEKFAGVLGAIDTRGLNVNLRKASRRQFAAVVVLFQCAGNAPHPRQHALANLGQDLAPGDNVGDGEASTRL